MVATTVVVLAAIPITVVAVNSTRTFNSKAAGGIYQIDSLVATQSVTPHFSWNCSTCNTQTIQYMVFLSEKSFSYPNFQNGWFKVVKPIISGNTVTNNFADWGGWGSTSTAQATRTLKPGTPYYWQVEATSTDGTWFASSPVVINSFTTPVSADTDKDGFSDTLEYNLGTNSNLACGPNSWPPDFNNDKTVNTLDLAQMAQHYGTSDRRYDLNMDGIVNGLDLNILSSYYLKSCS